MNYFDFSNSCALVSGGSTGLGREIAKGLLNSGCGVIIASRNEKRVMEVSKELSHETNGKCFGIAFDIGCEKDVIELMNQVSRRFDSCLNIVVNSSGFNIRNLVENIDVKEWSSIINTNLTGAFYLSKYALPLLKNASYGRLINITSIFSTVTFPERVSYSSSKGGLLLMGKTLALEWAKYGITVNSISPGPFLTDINKAVLNNPEVYKKFCEKIPLGRFGNPEEIVTSALFLASRYSSYITGCDIRVDGGWTSG